MRRINEPRYTGAQTRYFNILGRTEKTVILINLSLMFGLEPLPSQVALLRTVPMRHFLRCGEPSPSDRDSTHAGT